MTYLVLNRHRSGANYLAVHVQILAPENSRLTHDLAVKVQSPLKTLQDLTSSPQDPGTFQAPWASPVSRVLVGASGNVELSKFTYDVRCGQFWVGPTRKLSIKSIRKLSPTELPESWENGVALEVVPLAGSILKLPGQTVNWQGDVWLVMVPAIQIGLLCIGVTFLFQTTVKLRSKTAVSAEYEPFSSNGYGKVVQLGLSTVWVVAVLVMSHQAFLQLPQMLVAYDAMQFCIAGLAIVFVFGTSWGLAKWAAGQAKSIRIDLAAFGVLIAIGLLKAWWIVQNPTVQINDYDIYWRIAKAMAREEWQSLPFNHSGALASAYVTRAFPYYYPVVRIFGSSNEAIAWANLLTHMATLSVSYVLARRTIGLAAAIAALPLLAGFPDFWFGLTIASHDVPAMFQLVCVFLLVDFVRSRIMQMEQRRQPNHRNDWILLTVIAVITGIVSGILDVQRSYWPFLATAFLTAALISQAHVWISKPKPGLGTRLRNLSKSLTGVSLCVLIMFFTASVIRGKVVEKTGPLGTVSVLAYASGVDSKTSAKWNDIAPWAHRYIPKVDENSRSEVGFRRLIYEKVIRASDFWTQFIRRNTELAGFNYTMYHAVDKEDKVHSEEEKISWYEAKSFYCVCFGFGIAVLFVLRLILSARVPFLPGEVFPLLFSVTGFLLLLTVPESVAVYDIFLVFPLCWSASFLFALRPSNGKTSSEYVEWSRMIARAGRGLLVLTVFFFCHVLIGRMVKSAWPPFVTPVATAMLTKSGEGSFLVPSIIRDEVSSSVSFPSDSEQIERGQWTGIHIDLPIANASNSKLYFFLSTDQRRRKQTERDHWDRTPVRYELVLSGEVISSGLLEDLQEPQFISVDLGRRQEVQHDRLDLRLISERAWKLEPEQPAPVIAIEYAFYHHSVDPSSW
ncbi:MAG TPA: hypothetical protein DDZ51_13825 [Planctomycetaceae bacterium]|nr:hypothetical protein [Planctomycetaceae bacterium]